MINWLVKMMINGEKDSLGRKVTYDFCIKFINNHFMKEDREKRIKQLNMALIDAGREDLIPLS